MKFWTLLLALLLALSLTACGGKRNDGSAAGTNNNAQTGGLTGGSANDNATGNANGNTGNNGTGANNATNGTNDANGNTVPGDIDGNGDSLLNPDSNKDNGTNGNKDNAANSGNGSAANNGTAGSAANSQNDGNPVPQSHGGWKGASFDQMVRNGLVHDRDGILNDFENSVTPGSSHF